MSIKSTIVIQKEENWYVATSIESGVASQGKTIDESIANLKEALELYYEDNVPETQAEPVFITTLEVAV
ncbi:MAG: type II toxin-antitoxin system HicB family antitoxin [Clostridia bacterium]|nr:type II toxin-antitoxin system HicB family antitoxin [Clostridia bacterium]